VTAVLARLRSDLRGGWRSWLSLALLIGLFSGVVLMAAVGARRTATAYPRFLEATLAEDLLMSPANTGIGTFYEVLGDHPDVETIGVLGGAAMFPLGKEGDPEFTANVFMPVDGHFLYDIDRPRVIAGRVPRRDAEREVLVNPLAADRYDLTPGERFEMAALSFPSGRPDDSEPEVTPLVVNVVGIGVIPPDIVPTAKLDNQPTFVTSPAFYRTFVPDTAALGYDGVAIRLRPGTNVTQFRQEAQALATSFDEVGSEIFVGEQTDRTRKVERAIRPQAVALGGFAALAGLAGFLVLGQALTRQLSLDATEVPILRTLGFTRAQLAGLTVLRVTVVAVVAAAVAVVTAVALSPLTPIGAARRAEVHPGVEFHVAGLAVGSLLIIGLFVARASLPAFRLARVRGGVQGAADHGSVERLSVLARLGRQLGLPPAAATGVRMALESGHGRTAVPVRATLAGAIIGLAAVTTAVTFAVSLDRLVATPRLFGRTWDIVLDGQFRHPAGERRANTAFEPRRRRLLRRVLRRGPGGRPRRHRHRPHRTRCGPEPGRGPSAPER
jgi:putative ABC transport system permease protein